jgi:hypothetical protein
MDEVAGRAWIVGITTEAVRNANNVLRDRHISGFLFWEPRANCSTLRCEYGRQRAGLA